MKERALELLREAVANPRAEFRGGQWESIEALLASKRMLVVQRTGWGKSIVYFIATKLLREQGKGPTLLISPLLSLMRNQLEAAARVGLTSRTINSANRDEWDLVEEEIRTNQVDLLLISPERLGNEAFRMEVLPVLSASAGLFVVDEAHCISDWGHDFRPDYRRIVRVLDAFPPSIPVLATTATANDRVVEDVASQLGEALEISRGALTRESLKLHNIDMPNPAARMAWLAEHLPTFDGSGIVYTLTVRDADRLATWLKLNDINAEAYHAGLPAAEREALEQRLLANDVKALISTVALGMGFDKPDLKFVIHFQRPSSVVHYYQQVGRAGRGVDEAFGILFSGEEDDHIAEYFIKTAFPPQNHVNVILQALKEAEDGLSTRDMQASLNLGGGAIDKVLKMLSLESPGPVAKIGTKWQPTAAAEGYSINQQQVDAITGIRQAEQAEMQEYIKHPGCLMQFLSDALDDADPQACGKCANCTGDRLSTEVSHDLLNQASVFIKRSYQPIAPRRMWPQTRMMTEYGFAEYRFPAERIVQEGRALCLWRDAGWGEQVAREKEQNRYSDDLVEACVNLYRDWNPNPSIKYLVSVPSIRRPELVPDFAKRLAAALGLHYVEGLRQVRDNELQITQANSYQQAKNLDGVFEIAFEGPGKYGPCLLIDDVVNSGWTLTVGGRLLMDAGVADVYPLTLALNHPRMD